VREHEIVKGMESERARERQRARAKVWHIINVLRKEDLACFCFYDKKCLSLNP
jgi:hypothetical protein